MRTMVLATATVLAVLASLACNKDGQAATATAPQPSTTAAENAPTVATAPVAAGPAAPAAPAVAPAPADQAQPEAAGDKQYKVVAADAKLKVGATSDVKFTIQPAAGLHFNAEYPAKFAITPAAFAKSTKEKLSSKTGEVKVEGNNGVVTAPLQGLAAGGGTLEVVGSFSVCSNEQCYMLRDEKLTIKVTVQ